MLSLVRDAFAYLTVDDYGCSVNCQRGLESLKDFPKPVRRRHPIATVSATHDGIPQQQSSALFMKLPFEIRRMILLEAFGRRTLHMDLDCYRSGPLYYGAYSDHYMSKINVAHTLPIVGDCRDQEHLRSFQHTGDSDRRYLWLWWSSVCHRNLPGNLRGSMGARDGQLKAPWDDDCRNGMARYCRYWGTPGRCCRVGALGFLRSCRQAQVKLCSSSVFSMLIIRWADTLKGSKSCTGQTQFILPTQRYSLDSKGSWFQSDWRTLYPSNWSGDTMSFALAYGGHPDRRNCRYTCTYSLITSLVCGRSSSR